MIIRNPLPEEKKIIIDLWRYSFNEDSESFINHYFSTIYKEENTLIGSDKGEILSAMQCNPYSVTFQEKTFSVPYIIGISSFPEARSRGAGKETFAHLFNKYKREKIPFAILMAIDYGLYEPYGFAHIYDKYIIKGETKSLQKNQVVGYFSKIKSDSSEKDIKDIADFYQRMTSYYNFSLNRSVTDFVNNLNELDADNGFGYVLKNDVNQITGYLFYFFSSNQIIVKEIMFNDEKALQSILRFLFNHNTQYKYYQIRDEAPGRVSHFVPDRRAIKTEIMPFLTARIFDLQSLLEKLEFNSHFEKLFKLKVTDHHISSNNGVFLLQKNKAVSVSYETNTAYDLEISISLLTQLLFGYYDPLLAGTFIEKTEKNKEKRQFFLNLFSKKNTIYFNEYV